MTQNCTNHKISHRRIWDWKEWNSEDVLEWDRSDGGALRGPGGNGAPGRKPGTAHIKKHRQCVLKIMKKRHLSSWSLCSLVFLQKVVWRRQRGKNLILAATGIRYQLDLVEQP